MILIIMIGILFVNNCSARYIHPMDTIPKPQINSNNSDECKQFTTDELKIMIGTAFNSRYMSVEEPPIEREPIIVNLVSVKRSTGPGELPKVIPLKPFAVDINYETEISGVPAWNDPVFGSDIDPVWGYENGTAFQQTEATRHRRSTRRNLQPEYDSTLSNSKKSGRRHLRIRKKMDEDKPSWECEQAVVWKDLGSDYFPRYIRTIECKTKSCWYGYYSCNARAIPMKLMKKRNQCVAYMNGVEASDAILRPMWVFEEVAVTVCCECKKTPEKSYNPFTTYDDPWSTEQTD